MKIISFDPSGEWGKKGMGITGVAVWDNGEITTEAVKAEEFSTLQEYFQAHIDLIARECPKFVVCEDFLIDTSNTGNSYSDGKTIQLISLLKKYCFEKDIEIAMQMNNKIKLSRKGNYETDGKYSKKNLIRLGLMKEKEKNTKHERDALRHLDVFIRKEKKNGTWTNG